jgi:hypothetical protein
MYRRTIGSSLLIHAIRSLCTETEDTKKNKERIPACLELMVSTGK